MYICPFPPEISAFGHLQNAMKKRNTMMNIFISTADLLYDRHKPGNEITRGPRKICAFYFGFGHPTFLYSKISGIHISSCIFQHTVNLGI
jgi:hypothetical protein